MLAAVFPDELWSKIFDEIAGTRAIDFFERDDSFDTFRFRQEIHLSLVLVCHQWNRLGTPLLYRAFYHHHESFTVLFVKILRKRPDCAFLVQDLRISRCKAQSIVWQLHTLCPNLTRVAVDFKDGQIPVSPSLLTNIRVLRLNR